MKTASPLSSVRIGTGPDGILTYCVDRPLETLPAVRGRDLERAWDAAREAALSSRWGAVRGFRFGREDGAFTHLALTDADARCWAGAVDATVGMGSSYGLSTCIRLLAMIDLLVRARWAMGLLRLERDGAALHPSLLRAAGCTPLTEAGRFEEAAFRSRLPCFLPDGPPSAPVRITGATA